MPGSNLPFQQPRCSFDGRVTGSLDTDLVLSLARGVTPTNAQRIIAIFDYSTIDIAKANGDIIRWNCNNIPVQNNRAKTVH